MNQDLYQEALEGVRPQARPGAGRGVDSPTHGHDAGHGGCSGTAFGPDRPAQGLRPGRLRSSTRTGRAAKESNWPPIPGRPSVSIGTPTGSRRWWRVRCRKSARWRRISTGVTRSRISQLGAWASRQSRPLASRARLISQVSAYEAEYQGADIPRPEYWSGFRVIPHRIEFWTGRPFRLNDRLLYEKTDQGWTVKRLYP